MPAGLILVAGLACLAAGCGESRDHHMREDRIASMLPLAPQKTIRIETRTADVHIVPSPDDTIRVLTVKRVQSMSERSVEALWNQIHVTVERSGDDLILRVREPERGTSHVTVEAGPWRLRRRVEIEVTVAVPLGHPVSFLTEKGDVDARDLRQDLQMDVYNGDAQVSDLAGGDVSVNRAQGRIAVETSTGDADIVDGDGNVLISTSSGDVTVRARADSLIVETSAGDQDLNLSGPAKYAAVKSSSGTIELMIPKGSGGTLDVQTATGAMSIANAVRIGTMTRNHFTGDLGGGGQTVVRTSSGDIRLTAGGPAPPTPVEGDKR
jgi:hypothetical protein